MLFGVPFLGAIAGSYLVTWKRRRMRIDAQGVGDVCVVKIDVDTADAEATLKSFEAAIERVAEKFEKTVHVRPAGTDAEH